MRLHMEESPADDTGINDFSQYGVNYLQLWLGGDAGNKTFPMNMGSE